MGQIMPDDAYDEGYQSGMEIGLQRGIAIGLKRASKRGPHKPQSSDYRRGYIAGHAAGRNRAFREMENSDAKPRPEKYAFHTLAVNQTKIVGEKLSLKVYHAGRAWARRNAPSRKFSVKPTDQGTTITRTV